MSTQPPPGSLSANQIILRLAKPLADEDGFIEAGKLAAKMKQQTGAALVPADLRGDQVLEWAQLLGLYSKHVVARIVGGSVEVLPEDVLDQEMLGVLMKHLSGSEQKLLVDTKLFFPHFLRFYWKARDIYRGGRFRKDQVDGLRDWARRRIPDWP